MTRLNRQLTLTVATFALIAASLLLVTSAPAQQQEEDTGTKDNLALPKQSESKANERTTESIADGVNDNKAGMTVRQAWATLGDMVVGVSPNGRFFAFTDWSPAKGGNVGVYDRTSGDVQLLTDDASWTRPIHYSERNKIWSPDGRRIAYNWFDKGKFELRSIGRDGSEPRLIYRDDLWEYILPVEWSSDGRQILAFLETADRKHQHALISVADGSARVLKLRGNSPISVSLSPDGRYVVYDAPQIEDQPERDIYIMATDGSSEAGLVERPGQDYAPLWTADGKRLVFISDRNGSVNLWVLRVDGAQPVGDPQPIPFNASCIEPLGITRSGGYFYHRIVASWGTRGDVYVATVNLNDGKLLKASSKLIRRYEGRNTRPSWAPGGKYLAYISNRSQLPGGGGSPAMVIHSMESSSERVVSLPNWQEAARPQWSPDSSSLLYIGSTKKGLSAKYVVDVQSGIVAPLAPTINRAHRQNDAVWSVDGKMVFYIRRVDSDQNKLNMCIIASDRMSGQEKLLFQNADHLSGSDAPRGLAVSPDGRQLAFASLWNLSVIPVGGGMPRVVFQAEPNDANDNLDKGIAWSNDGRWLIFGLGGSLFQIPVEGGTPRKLDLGTEGLAISHFSLHPDGRQIVFSAHDRDGSTSLMGGIFVLENFLPPLERAQ